MNTRKEDGMIVHLSNDSGTTKYFESCVPLDPDRIPNADALCDHVVLPKLLDEVLGLKEKVKQGSIATGRVYVVLQDDKSEVRFFM